MLLQRLGDCRSRLFGSTELGETHGTVHEVGSAARRMVRALVKRAEEGDTEAIEQLVETQHEVTQSITTAGRALHEVAGYSYTELGRVLGTSRQAARERFGVRVTA